MLVNTSSGLIEGYYCAGRGPETHGSLKLRRNSEALKRTTATAVCRVYEDFLVRFPTVQELGVASEEDLIRCLSGVGLQRQRARSLTRLAAWLITNHEGDVPCNLESLVEVPGLGNYSAAAILSFGYDIPIAVLDANVERILIRVFNNSLPPRASTTMLNEVSHRLLPPDNHQAYNYGLLDFGRLVCRYADPKCGVCPLRSICDFWARSNEEKGGGEPRDPSEDAQSKLKAVRQQCGLSQQRLAELTGVSKLTVIRIESGKTAPRQETLEKLAIALEVEPDELRGRPPDR